MPVRKKRRPAQTYSPAVSPELLAGRNRSFLKCQLCVYLQRLFQNQPPQPDRETYGVICFAMGESWIKQLRENLSECLPRTRLARLNADLEEADDADDAAFAIIRALKNTNSRVRRRVERSILRDLDKTIGDYDLLAEAPRTKSQVEANIKTTAEIFGLTEDEREVLLFLLIMFIFEEAEGFFMDPELGPGQHFYGFLERSEPAGHGDKPARQFCHQRFAFMHGVYNPQILQISESNFLFDQNLRDDADNIAVFANHGVGDLTHQADVASAIDEGNTTFCQSFAQFTGRFYIF